MSLFNELKERQALRSVYTSPLWFPEFFEAMNKRIKLFFIIDTNGISPKNKAQLFAEQYQFRDLVLVDSKIDKKDDLSRFEEGDETPTRICSGEIFERISGLRNNTSTFKPPFIECLGLLTILNRFDMHYIALIRKTNIFINVRNLVDMADRASGRAMFDKTKAIGTFLITHHLTKKDVGKFYRCVFLICA